MNKVILQGRLTQDIDLRVANSGTSIARFKLAVDRRTKAEGQPSADFITCLAFGKTAEALDKWFQKGKGIIVIGQIQTGSYTNNNGDKVYTTEVLVNEWEFPIAQKGTSNASTGSVDGFDPIPDGIDEELPFN